MRPAGWARRGAAFLLFFFFLPPYPPPPHVIPAQREGSSMCVCVEKALDGEKARKDERDWRESASHAADGDVSANQRLMYNYTAALIQV